MTIAESIINAALISRGLVPLNPVCPCCGHTERDDFTPASEWKYGAEMIEKYGQMPCTACADEHAVCDRCDALYRMDDDAAVSDMNGEFCSQECADEVARDVWLDAEHVRQERTY